MYPFIVFNHLVTFQPQMFYPLLISLFIAQQTHQDKCFFHFILKLPGKLNELDNNGDLALDLALSKKLESIATTLVNNKADVDMVDQSGWSLLHKAIQRGDECLFLGGENNRMRHFYNEFEVGTQLTKG